MMSSSARCVCTLLGRFPDFTLNLGNHHGNRLQGLSDFKAVMPHVNERAKVLIDTGHLLSVGENVLAFAEAFANRVGLVHVRDQKGETPVPFGQGDLPFKDLLGILKNAGYNGILVIELEKITWGEPAHACKMAREFVQNLLAS